MDEQRVVGGDGVDVLHVDRQPRLVLLGDADHPHVVVHSRLVSPGDSEQELVCVVRVEGPVTRHNARRAVVDGEVGAVGFRLHAEQSPDDADNRRCVVVHEDTSRIVNVALEEMVHGDGNERRLASRDLQLISDENAYGRCRLRLCLLRWWMHHVLPLGGQHVVRKGVVYGKQA